MSVKVRNTKKVKSLKSDTIFINTVNVLMVITLLIVIIPVLNIIASSFSLPSAVSAGKVGIWPVGFTVQGYKLILQNPKLVIGYKNTIFYTVVGTLICLFMTTIAAYPLSRKDFKARNIFMKIFTITMYFSGGIIPSYLLMKNLGFINTRWVMLIPGALSVHNMIVMRTSFQTNIPDELLESAKIDGCDDFRFLAQFVIPLSKAIIAVMVLYYAVGKWNTYFSAYMYLSDESLYPLSIFFQLLLGGTITQGMEVGQSGEFTGNREIYSDLLRYALIVVTCVPVWCAYPFVQKYFVRGVMTGAVKG